MKNENIPTVQIIVAIISAIAVIINALILLQAAREPVLLTISATQTAQAQSVSSPVNTGSTQGVTANANLATPIVGTMAVTPVPNSQTSTSSSTTVLTPNNEVILDYVPGIRFSPNSYFLFSIIVGIFIFTVTLMTNFEEPFGFFWLIYIGMITFYFSQLQVKNLASLYDTLLIIILTAGLGILAKIKPYAYRVNRDSTVLKLILSMVLLPLSIGIIIAGWQQYDLLVYASKIFSWNMTVYVIVAILNYLLFFI